MLFRFTELAAPEQDEAEDAPCRGLPACWGNRHRGLERGTADGERLVGWNVALDALPIFLEISRIGAPSARSIASDSHVRSLASNESMLSPSGCLLLPYAWGTGKRSMTGFKSRCARRCSKTTALAWRL